MHRSVIFRPITKAVDSFDLQSEIEGVAFFINNTTNPKWIDYNESYCWTWKGVSLSKLRDTIIVVTFNKAGN